MTDEQFVRHVAGVFGCTCERNWAQFMVGEPVMRVEFWFIGQPKSKYRIAQGDTEAEAWSNAAKRIRGEE